MAAITTLLNFDFANSEYLTGSLVEDAAGDLFGTAVGGPSPGTESVFEIANTVSGYTSAPTVLATFDDMSFDASELAIDAAGDLFAQTDGPDQSTNIYEIAKSAGGYEAPALLANVGGEPAGSVVVGGSGDLIGLTAPDTSSGDMNVYELAADGSGYASDASTIATIALPEDDFLSGESSLLLARDSVGDLFVAFSSGPFVATTVVIDEIAKTPTGYATPQTLGSFRAMYGELDSLLVDVAGNVFARADGYSSAIVEIAKTDDGYAASPTYTNSFLPAGLVGDEQSGNPLRYAWSRRFRCRLQRRDHSQQRAKLGHGWIECSLFHRPGRRGRYLCDLKWLGQCERDGWELDAARRSSVRVRRRKHD